MAADIKGLDQLNAKLQAMAAKAQREGDPVVAVGYTAAYALYVHENMEIWPPGMRLAGQPRSGRRGKGYYWDPQGKARPKFLESPLREFRQELANIVVVALSRGKTMAQALLLAGLRLQRESQQLVPVDTGTLRASAFTRLEVGESSAGEVNAST